MRILDGDDIRNKIHVHLDFSIEGIKKNNCLIASLCRDKLYDYDCILISVIAPFRELRKENRRTIGDSYFEVYVKASLDTVIKRDTKGLYKKALNGQIENFIGIDQKVPYQEPLDSDLILDTEQYTSQELVNHLLNFYDAVCNNTQLKPKTDHALEISR